MYDPGVVLALRLALGLLAACGFAALVGPLVESRHRQPEVSVRAYLEAVERGNLAGALETIAPEARAESVERVANQLGNRYRVDVVALATPSLLARASGAPDTTARTTILAEVEPRAGERWKSTSVVTLLRLDNRWYLAEPPFA